MVLHTARVAPEKLTSHQPAAVHLSGISKGIDMQIPRMVMPLIDWKDNSGNRYEAVLNQGSHEEEPRIKILRWSGDSLKATVWMDFFVSALLSMEVKGEQIQQVLGDGPETASISDTTALDVAKLALGCLPPTAGRFEIVWVPNDGQPF